MRRNPRHRRAELVFRAIPFALAAIVAGAVVRCFGGE